MKHLALLCLLCASAFAITKPTLPQLQVDTSIPPVTGKSIPVNAGADLQAAINAANPGDELVLQAGAVFIGNYELPNKNGSGWITIRSSNMSRLPVPGNRVAPADAANMPTVMAYGVSTAFHLSPGAHNYRLMGLEITERPGQSMNYGLIMAGDPNDPNPADLPNHIILDRCYVHGQVLSHIKFGWQMNGMYLAVVDSYFSEFHGLGQDTQAITGYMGQGPLKIVNNFLEGAGENVLFGGASDAIPNTITADVTFTGNYLYKPDTWRTQPLLPQVKNASAIASSTGTLAAGSYYYAVIAEGTLGTLDSLPGQAQSWRSAEVSSTLSTPGSITVAFTEAPYGDSADSRMADHYTICRTPDAPGSPSRTWTYFDYTPKTPSGPLSFVDDGTATPLSGFGEWPRQWAVKNLFECKNGERWLVQGNVMEGNWVSAQAGFSILFTPRNENPGPMAGNHVWDITFRDNVIRHVAGGINIGSEDDTMANITGIDITKLIPTERIWIYDNLFEDVNWAYNGNGVFFQSGPGAFAGLPGAEDVTLDHNTVFQNGNFAGLGDCCGLPMPNFTFTNNVFGEGSYGWFVSGHGQSLAALQSVMNPLVFTNNVWAGDPGPYQIPNNMFPSDFNSVGFVNYNNGNGGDYHLASSSPYKGQASDGTDPGANMDTLNAVIAQDILGQTAPAVVPNPTPTPVPVVTPPVVIPPVVLPPSIPTLWMRLISLNSGKCLTGQSDGTVQQYACSISSDAQLFTLIPAYDDNGKLLGYQFALKNGLSLDVWGASGSDGATVGQYAFKASGNEIFSLHQNAAGYFTITANHSGKCLDIAGVSKTNGAKLQQWGCGTGTNQQWSLNVQSVQ